MGKSCCAIGCTNRYSKQSGIHFYRFPTDSARRARWIGSVGRKNWIPTEHSWICSVHFISGAKSNDPLSPDYVPSVFSHVKGPIKRKRMKNIERYERMAETKKRRIDNTDRLSAARSLLDLSNMGNGDQFCEPHTGTYTMTSLSMFDIKKLECDEQNLREENIQLKNDYELLSEANKKLMKENSFLKEQCEHLEKECRKLRESSRLKLRTS